MVLSEKVMELQLTLVLRIELPEGIASKPELVVTATSLWCQPDINPEFYDIGFKLTGVSDEDIRIIQRMVEEYGFRE